MIIEHGDLKNPTGNAVIFWHLKGNNKVLKKAEIIASNFVVSPLQSDEETLMVNFPPVLVDTHEKLLRIAEANNLDLIRGGEIYVPEDITDFSNFYKKQIEKYNGIIREYLVAFKEKNSAAQEVEPQKPPALPSPPKIQNIPLLIGQAGQILASIRKIVRTGSNAKLIDVKIDRLREIQEILNREMGGVDLERVIGYIDRPEESVDALVDLYTRKLLALFLENYESADELRKRILTLEQGSSL